FTMESSVRGVDEDVIHVDDEPTFCDEVGKDVIYKCLDSQGRVAKTKEHDVGFKETKRSDEGGLPSVR
ncbi:hypothetical protein BS17DRAFT_716726, partial [Gyrodon lividus]